MLACSMCEYEINEGSERWVLVGTTDELRHAGSGDEMLVCKKCAETVIAFVVDPE